MVLADKMDRAAEFIRQHCIVKCCIPLIVPLPQQNLPKRFPAITLGYRVLFHIEVRGIEPCVKGIACNVPTRSGRHIHLGHLE